MSLLIGVIGRLHCSTLNSFSRLQSPTFRCIRSMSTQASEIPHTSSTSEHSVGWLWDPHHRIRVIGALTGIIGASGILFDTFYRRATKQELHQTELRLEEKINNLGNKIDNLANALIHTSQRDRIATESENRELRKEIERLKISNVSRA